MLRIQAGNPVTGTDFIGREDEINQIISFLKMGQSVVILAPRRFGKTSLVLEILSRLGSSKNYTAFVDVFSSPTIPLLSTHIIESVLKNHKLDRIFTKSRHSALAMIKNVNLKTVLDDFEFILGFAEREPDRWQMLGESIDFVDNFAIKHNKAMYCAFDEFGDIKKLNGDKITKLFRSKIQQHKQSAYLFSGSYESVMNTIFVDKSSPFYRFARIIRLGFIDKDAFKAKYQYYFDSYKINYKDKFINKILNFTQGHPYYSQLALQETIIFHTLNLRLPKFSELQNILENTERSYLEKTWEDVSKKRENVLALLALSKSGEKVYSVLQNQGINAYRALQSLLSTGLISKTKGNGYHLNDPLLEVWIRKNILKA